MTVSDNLAAKVREVRKLHGWQPADLAARCAEVGAPHLTENAIENIESGRRSDGRRRRAVTVDELIALALALDVAPVHLVVPLDDDQPWAMTETVTKRAHVARQWFRGLHALKDTDRRIYYSQVPERELARFEAFAKAMELNPDQFHLVPEAMEGDDE
jgi:transcriptional regulator with XRE-family HTH domain